MILVDSPFEISNVPNSLLLIPEIGLAHYGNLQLALNFVDLVAKLGLKVVKFQHHNCLYESSQNEQFRVSHEHFPFNNRYEYWKQTSFTTDEWSYLYSYVLDKGLSFSITPNSLQSAIFIKENIPPCFWKVGSSDICNYQLLDFLVSTNTKSA